MMELYLLLMLAGMASGVLTILFGFGGGFVVVPLVFYCIRSTYPIATAAYALAFKSAIATSLLLMIFNAGWASWQQARQGKISRGDVVPMAYWIALGALLGGSLAVRLPAIWLKWAFVSYVLLSLLDAVLRQLKTVPLPSAQTALSSRQQGAAGLVIGTLAASLGVGGSVLTVPLFCRRGLSMASAVALANPLSLPVALVGALTLTLAYVIAPQPLGQHFYGYFYVPAVVSLLMGGWIGMQLTRPWVGRISNRVHARGYILLLTLVLLSVVLR
jgi:uncharacterized membrane protein YfcA